MFSVLSGPSQGFLPIFGSDSQRGHNDETILEARANSTNFLIEKMMVVLGVLKNAYKIVWVYEVSLTQCFFNKVLSEKGIKVPVVAVNLFL